MNEKIDSYIESVGAITEISKIYFDNYLRCGFNEDQALDLTKHMIETKLILAASTQGPPMANGEG